MKFNYDKVISALGETQSTYHWWVEFLGEAQTDNDVVTPFQQENVYIRVTTSALPTPNIEHRQIQVQGRTINQVGKVDKSGEIGLTFVEGTDTAVMDAITNWLEAYWTSLEGKQRETNKVKLKIVLHLLDGNDDDTMTYTLRGCLPKLEPGGELGQDSNTLMPVLTVSYDDYEYKGKAGKTW
jgi:hypothetical protein